MIRDARADDASRIAEIQICGWRNAYRGLISDYELFAERQVVLAAERLKKRIEESRLLVYEDDADRILKGFAWHGRSRDEDKADAYEIYALYVQPEFTRNGIGELLVNRVIEMAESESYQELMVWVLSGNGKGMGFYRKNRFMDDGKTKMIEKWNREEIRMVRLLK